MGQIPLDIEEVARCAWNEILQTAPRSTSLFGFLEDLLEPGPNLVWRERGPGRGIEMRRSFSGLFGRFFARAYLQLHHGFVWFAAIDGNNFSLSKRWRVSIKPGSKTEMPDWVCARPGELALAEAKGSHCIGNATRGGMPGPVKTADGQIRGVHIQKWVNSGAKPILKRVKGWAVMSRWGVASPARDPYLYVLDPETEGETLTPEEIDEFVQAVARTHMKQTALGLGLLRDRGEEIAVGQPRRVRVADDPGQFAGMITTPFGPLDVDLARAKEIAALLPNPDLVRFVGLDEDLLANYLRRETLAPRSPRRIGDLSLVGGDGLVVAPVQQIIDLGYYSPVQV